MSGLIICSILLRDFQNKVMGDNQESLNSSGDFSGLGEDALGSKSDQARETHSEGGSVRSISLYNSQK